MSINPINSALAARPCTSPLKPGPDTSALTHTFAEAMEEASGLRRSDSRHNSVAAASAAAELFRLQMMRNALSLGDDNLTPLDPSTKDPVKMIIESVLIERQNIDSNQPKSHFSTNSVTPQATTTPPSSLMEIIETASQRYGVDEALIKAVVKTESNFNPNAVSHAGAQGLMQLMPGTARGLGVKNSFDPEQNVMAGTRFLKDLLNRYQGNLDSALAAYNWGPGNVDRKGITALPQETREYLAKVKSLYSQYTG